jgi:hypothetical protein
LVVLGLTRFDGHLAEEVLDDADRHGIVVIDETARRSNHQHLARSVDQPR